MTHAEIIAHVSRRELRQDRESCACGKVRLYYLPEVKLGNVTHGALVCVREDEAP